MDRLINRRQQGDLGEASATEWLTRQGATVFLPFGHSPDVDLVADLDGRLIRVQVKTTTYKETRATGERWQAQLATNGGNQSWNRVAKKFDRSRTDYLYVLTGNGRRWFIPATAVEASTNVALGGSKYSEFEIEPSSPIAQLVYGANPAHLESAPPGECPSGQRELTVNQPAMPTQVRILPPPSEHAAAAGGVTGTTQVWGKRRITIPLGPFAEAGLEIGDRVRATCVGEGEVALSRIDPPVFAQPSPGTLDE